MIGMTRLGTDAAAAASAGEPVLSSPLRRRPRADTATTTTATTTSSPRTTTDTSTSLIIDAATPSPDHRRHREMPPCVCTSAIISVPRTSRRSRLELEFRSCGGARDTAWKQQQQHALVAPSVDSSDGDISSTQRPHSPTSALLLQNPSSNGSSSRSSVTATVAMGITHSQPTPGGLASPRIRQPELNASDFQRESVLGEGSYSLVTLATHRPSGLLFALKEIDLRRLRHQGLEAQLRWEINLQRTLRHPNVVRLYSYFVTSSCICLVLEYCQAGTLLQRVRASPGGRLAERQASRYTRHIARALTHLHERGFAHRDLKLENVLLGEDDVAKLGDFGWSRPMDASHSTATTITTAAAAGTAGFSTVAGGTSRSVSRHGLKRGGYNSRAEGGGTEKEEKEQSEREGRRTVCGTLDYLSPEMVSGDAHSFKTDVWSLGVMVAEMMTGSPPFYRDSPQQTLQAIRYKAPNLRGTAMSVGARVLIESMLAKDPERRPAMSEVLRHPWLQKPPRPSQ